MPLLHVILTPGAFDAAARQHLVTALTDAACRAESVPDDPGSRMRALVLVNELAAGNFFSAATPADEAVAGVFIDWQVSAGVLDGARKARFADEVHRAVAELAAPGRLTISSCVVHEVPEGQWAQNGAVRRLPEVARLAGFEHLASLTVGDR